MGTENPGKTDSEACLAGIFDNIKIVGPIIRILMGDFWFDLPNRVGPEQNYCTFSHNGQGFIIDHNYW